MQKRSKKSLVKDHQDSLGKHLELWKRGEIQRCLVNSQKADPSKVPNNTPWLNSAGLMTASAGPRQDLNKDKLLEAVLV